MLQQRRVRFFGMVQGVGFRWTTRHTAGNYEVTGWVRNLPDGSVEMLAEGEPQVLDAFLDDLCSRMEHYIREHRVQEGPASRSFQGFSIQH